MRRVGSGSSIGWIFAMLAVVCLLIAVASCTKRESGIVKPESAKTAIQAHEDIVQEQEQQRKKVYQHDLDERSKDAKSCTLVTAQGDKVPCIVFYAEGHPETWGYDRIEYNPTDNDRLSFTKDDFIALVGPGANAMCEFPERDDHIVYHRVIGIGYDHVRHCFYVEALGSTGAYYKGDSVKALRNYLAEMEKLNRQIEALQKAKEDNKEPIKRIPEVFQPGCRVNVRLREETWRVGLDGVVEGRSVWKKNETLSVRVSQDLDVGMEVKVTYEDTTWFGRVVVSSKKVAVNGRSHVVMIEPF